jgi:hypothetical protein
MRVPSLPPILFLVCFLLVFLRGFKMSVLLAMVALACNTTPSEPPPPRVPKIKLEAGGVGVVEAWIEVSIDSTVQSRQIELRRNRDSVLFVGSIAADTVIIDEWLQPSTSYTYRGYLLSDSVIVDSSDELRLTTMDTTSHEISWRLDTLSEWGGVLHDVALIDENNIWVVGEIFLSDSIGLPDPSRYGLGQWDGSRWNFSRIYWNCRLYDPTCSGDTLLNAQAFAVFAFSSSDIWISAGSMHHFDGSSWREYGNLPLYSVNKIWGSESSNVYAIGLDGLIAHFNGSGWAQLQSGTTLDVQDIYGATDLETGEQEILCVASEGNDRLLLSIDGTTVTPVPDEGLAADIDGVWFGPGRYYYVVGDGIHERKAFGAPDWSVYPPGVITTYHSAAINGTDINDVFVVGSFMEMVHFNGVGWKNYRDEIPLTSGALVEIAVSEGLVVAVGLQGQDAIVLFGTR